MSGKHLDDFIGEGFGVLDLLWLMRRHHELLVKYEQYPNDGIMIRIVHIS
jgi:hypothetical protein